MARKGGNAFTELIHSSQRRKRIYLAKTCPEKAETLFFPFVCVVFFRKKAFPKENDAKKREKALTEGKRRSQRRKRVYQANTFLAKAKKRLPNETAMPERKCGSQSFKRVYPANIYLRKAKKLYRAKTSLTNAKSLYRATTSLANAKTVLPSENNVCKCENAVTERKSDKRAKTS